MSFFKNIPELGDMELKEISIWYDGPQVFTVEGSSGIFLCITWHDDPEHIPIHWCSYWLIPITPKQDLEFKLDTDKPSVFVIRYRKQKRKAYLLTEYFETSGVGNSSENLMKSYEIL